MIDNSHNYPRTRMLWLALLLLAILFAHTQTSYAQGSIEPNDGSSNGVLPDTMRAFQIGHYYFVTGEYDRAESYFTEAIDYLPDDFFDFAPQYAFLYLYLAESQFLQSEYAEAAVHYARYIDIAAEDALPYAETRLAECEHEQRANTA